MPSVNIQIEKVEPHVDIAMVQIDGSLDTVASYALQEQMEKLIDSGVYKFIVNLEKLDYISSAGIGVFPGLSYAIKIHQGGIVFIHVPEKIAKLFAMLGLTTIFEIRETTEEALKDFLHDEVTNF